MTVASDSSSSSSSSRFLCLSTVMRRVFLSVAALLLLQHEGGGGSMIASMAAAVSPLTNFNTVRLDFIQGMNEATRQHGHQRNKLRRFQQDLLAKARPSKNGRALDQANYNDDAYAAGDDAGGNNDDAYAAGDDAAAGNDDAYNAYVNDDGIDLREHALKYVGCSTVNTWSDNMAADADYDTVFALKSFVVFRMCPSDTCSTYNQYGCLYDFSELMIEMEDYLALVSAYHYSSYAEYCSTCDACMNGGGNQRQRNLDQGDDDAYVNDDAAADDDAAAAGDDDAAAAAGDDGYQCQYADACSNYQEACAGYSDDVELYDDYFACAQFEINGQVSYLGPHCQSDGQSITIGIFSDKYCTNYVGTLDTMNDVTGMSFDDSSLEFYYSQSCISCNASEQYNLDVDQDDIYDLCYELYDSGAKCNRALYESDRYKSDNQEETEDEVCEFIESLITNTYDEYGEINVADMYFDPSHWYDVTEYTKVVSPAQIFGLVASSLLMVGLAIYAIVLYHKLRTTQQYTIYHTSPRGSPNTHLAGKISRVHSGILSNRSRSSQGPGVIA